MNSEGWLADTRTSYDTVAASYADLVRNLLAETPYERATLALFQMVSRFAEAYGQLRFVVDRLLGRQAMSIEYK